MYKQESAHSKPLTCCDQMGLTELGFPVLERMEDTGWNWLLPSKRWMRFRHWERTQLWRFDAGGGDIVGGRRLRQLPPSCQPRSLRGLTRVYSRGVQPGSPPLPDSRSTPGAPEQGRGRGQAGLSPGDPRGFPEFSGFPSDRASGVRSRPCLQTGFQRKFVVFLFLLSLSLSPSFPGVRTKTN